MAVTAIQGNGADQKTWRLANNDMVEGYLDGFGDYRERLPSTFTNRSHSYRYGWLNGRDDRMNSPRAAAQDLRDAADEAMRLDAVT